ncbi:transposase zinc-binding domain-containing protein, partial [Pseudobutyrivibrio sp. MD2005]
MGNILQEIFLDNYEEFMMTTHPRQAVIDNVNKMIECGNPSFGGAMYGCTKCG